VTGRSDSCKSKCTVPLPRQWSCRCHAHRVCRGVFVALGWRHKRAGISRIQIGACTKSGLGEVHSRGRLSGEDGIRPEFSGASHRHMIFERIGDVRRYSRGRRDIRTTKDTGWWDRRTSNIRSAHGEIWCLPLLEFAAGRAVVSRARHSRVVSMSKEPS
jgi:hypothetical protein